MVIKFKHHARLCSLQLRLRYQPNDFPTWTNTIFLGHARPHPPIDKISKCFSACEFVIGVGVTLQVCLLVHYACFFNAPTSIFWLLIGAVILVVGAVWNGEKSQVIAKDFERPSS